MSKSKQILNDEGKVVPEKCTKCGGDVKLYIQGEPVYLCSKCNEYYGVIKENKTIIISEEQKKKLKKAIAAQDQVGGKVNAACLDNIMVCEDIDEEMIFQHGATPHKELPDFKPNLQPLIMYKQFKLRLDKNGRNLAPGVVFPLYVNTENGLSGNKSQGLQIGKWYKSGEGECWLDTENNRLYTKGKGYGTDGNTMSKLAYRPGWHLTTTPWGNQRGANKVTDGLKGTGNNYLNTRDSEVWAKIEICVDIDATERARAKSTIPADQCLGKLGDREFYKYRTNTNATDDQSWYIVDCIRIISILDDDTVDSTNDNYYNNLLQQNPDKVINSNPRTYTKDNTNEIPFWRMPRTNGIRYTKDDLKNMGYNDVEPTKLNENREWNEDFDYKPYLKSIVKFLKEQGMDVNPRPKVKLHREEQEGLYIKTGFYDPEHKEINLFVADRHPKDVLRSFVHEWIHSIQDSKGQLVGYKGETLDGDDALQKLEEDAYLRGNIYFRKWTETVRPVYPSKSNKLISESIIREETSELLSWFAGSKVVDKEGNPLPMYHGTNAEFDTFSQDFFGHGSSAYLGIGFYFTPSDYEAKGYGKNVHEVYIRALNPITNANTKTISLQQLTDIIYEIDKDEDPDNTICTNMLGERIVPVNRLYCNKAAKIIYENAEDDIDIYGSLGLAYSGDNDKKIVKIFEGLGYDSLILYNDRGFIEKVLAFEPEQIRNINSFNLNESIEENADLSSINVLPCLDYYNDKGVRELCHKIKDGDPQAIEKGAEIMAKYVKPDNILVPIPSHNGLPTVTLQLANAIARIKGCKVSNILRGNKREPYYNLKKNGAGDTDNSFFGFFCNRNLKLNKAILIDNVIGTGNTCKAASNATGIKNVLVLAKDNSSMLNEGYTNQYGDEEKILEIYYYQLQQEDEDDEPSWFICGFETVEQIFARWDTEYTYDELVYTFGQDVADDIASGKGTDTEYLYTKHPCKFINYNNTIDYNDVNQVNNAAKEYFEVVSDIKLADFILTDGTLLSVGRYRGEDHNKIGLIAKDKYHFVSLGNIRINANNGLAIHLHKMPTQEQITQLNRLFENVGNQDVIVECGEKYATYSPWDTSSIIPDLSNYFATGIWRKDQNTGLSSFLEESIDEFTNPEDVDLSSFDVQDNLNNAFWKNDKLESRVRIKLLDIANDFWDSLNINWVEPEDIIMTGSLANYNWSKQYSDIDLHIIIDFSKVDENTELVKEYFDSKRKVWNNEHKIEIMGFPIEVYVQDMNEPHSSSGVYSLENNEWIKKPQIENLGEKDLDRKDVQEKVSEYMNLIDDICELKPSPKVYEIVRELFNSIKNTRKRGFEKDDREYNEGNIIFKALRRNGYIEKLIDFKTKIYDYLQSF